MGSSLWKMIKSHLKIFFTSRFQSFYILLNRHSTSIVSREHLTNSSSLLLIFLRYSNTILLEYFAFVGADNQVI